MKKSFLKQIYSFDSQDQTFHVVINLDNYRDVCSEWDYSPIVNRDLDQSLLEYLLECSEEITLKNNMALDLYVPQKIIDKTREEKSIKGFRHHFSYQIKKIEAKKRKRLKSIGLLLVTGLTLLILANLINLNVSIKFLKGVLSEGFFIGAWVAFWEIFSIIFFEISSLKEKINHFKRFEKMKIKYFEK